MKIDRLSPKQRLTVNWWRQPEYRGCDAVICDGAVRSGKTFALSLGFVLWASSSFSGQSFAMCGKTVTSLRRNVIAPLLPLLSGLGISCREKISSSYIDISMLGNTNRFYLFGGRDEGSASLIQGITLALCRRPSPTRKTPLSLPETVSPQSVWSATSIWLISMNSTAPSTSTTLMPA